MKKILLLGLILSGYVHAICQSTGTYPADVDKAYGVIKHGAFKNGYHYLITFSDVNEAAINVKPNTSYLIFFLYDNTLRPVPHFKAFLMTPDSVLQKKYTAKPFDRGQVGVARTEQLQFHTPAFTGKDTRPVKFETKPKTTIYIFYKK